MDVDYGFIRQHKVTDGSVHDSREMEELLDGNNSDKGVWGDSAYRSQEIEGMLKGKGYESHIHEKGCRNKPLTEEQQTSNREKSKIRAKVEHVFGHGREMYRLGVSTSSTTVRTYQGLKDLTYNLNRYVFWEKQKKQPIGRCNVAN